MISRSLLFNKDMDFKCKNNDNNNNNNINNNNTYNLLENIMREDSVTSMDLNLTGFYLVCGTRLSNIVFYDVFTNSIGHNIQLYNIDIIYIYIYIFIYIYIYVSSSGGSTSAINLVVFPTEI